RASKLAVAEAELEEDRKSLYKRIPCHQHREGTWALAGLPQEAKGAGGKEEGRTRGEVPRGGGGQGGSGHPGARGGPGGGPEAPGGPARGGQRIADWATKASLALVPLGMSPIQVA